MSVRRPACFTDVYHGKSDEMLCLQEKKIKIGDMFNSGTLKGVKVWGQMGSY